MTNVFKIRPMNKAETVDECIERINKKIEKLIKKYEKEFGHVDSTKTFEEIQALEVAISLIEGYVK